MAAKANRASVSVIMPVLNEAAHLEAAVGSVLAQDFDGEIEPVS
jgi:succinoglycan biosynthesis protein ExoA